MTSPDAALFGGLDLVAALVAALDASNATLWSNRAWAKAMRLDDDETLGAEPSRYYTGARLVEYEALLERVRTSDHAVRFRDIWIGKAYDTIIKPTGEGRLLVVSNPLTPGEADLPLAPADCEQVEMTHRSWGRLESLTRRERDVLKLLASGLTIRQAAGKLERSMKTVEGHRDSLYRKLEMNTRAELAMLAMQAGLISSPSEQA